MSSPSDSSSGPKPPSQSAPALNSALSPVSTVNDSAPPPGPGSSTAATATVTSPPRPPPTPPTWSMTNNMASANAGTRLPPAYAPNSSVPKFIHALAVIVFVVGGTTTAIVTWFYKSIVYPRLVKALLARTRLTHKSQGLYTKLVAEHVTALYNGKGGALLRSGQDSSAASSSSSDTVHEEQHGSDDDNDSIAEEKAKLLGEPGADAATKNSDDEGQTIESRHLPPPAQVLAPITSALASLAGTLPAPGTATTLPATLPSTTSATYDSDLDEAHTATSTTPSSSSAPSTSINLLQSLHKLNEYLDTESYAVVTSSSFRYQTGSLSSTGTSTGGGKERRVLLEAVQNLKSEIRGVKGALLNRRNFAALAPRGVPTGSGPGSGSDMGLVQG